MASLISQDRLDVLARLARETAHLPGVMAEVGVYRGGSAKVIADACRHKTIHLYDTFSGIPEDDEHPQGHHRRGDFAAPLGEVKEHLFGRRVAYHAGVFPGTAVDAEYSFVHLDGDTFQTTRDALAYFWPRLVPGGCLVLDDYGWDHCPGVRRAVEEFLPGERVEVLAPYQAVVWKGGRPPVVVEITADGIGDAVLMSAVVSGVKAAGVDVRFKVRGHHVPWLSMYKDVPVVTEGEATYRPYDGYGDELRECGRLSRLDSYSRHCGGYRPVMPTWEAPAAGLDWARPHAGAVLLFPYSHWASRNWPMRHWLTLEGILVARGKRVIIMDSPGDGERTSQFTSLRFWGQSPERTAGMIALSEGMIGNDSGMAHLAGALGVPAVAVLAQVSGPGVFGFWPSVRTITGSLHCNGCHWRGPHYRPAECDQRCESLATVRPQDVAELYLNRTKELIVVGR